MLTDDLRGMGGTERGAGPIVVCAPGHAWFGRAHRRAEACPAAVHGSARSVAAAAPEATLVGSGESSTIGSGRSRFER